MWACAQCCCDNVANLITATREVVGRAPAPATKKTSKCFDLDVFYIKFERSELLFCEVIIVLINLRVWELYYFRPVLPLKKRDVYVKLYEIRETQDLSKDIFISYRKRALLLAAPTSYFRYSFSSSTGIGPCVSSYSFTQSCARYSN